jgi:hypothetical protein
LQTSMGPEKTERSRWLCWSKSLQISNQTGQWVSYTTLAVCWISIWDW